MSYSDRSARTFYTVRRGCSIEGLQHGDIVPEDHPTRVRYPSHFIAAGAYGIDTSAQARQESRADIEPPKFPDTDFDGIPELDKPVKAKKVTKAKKKDEE